MLVTCCDDAEVVKIMETQEKQLQHIMFVFYFFDVSRISIVCAGASLTVTTRTTTKKNTKKSADPQKLPGLCLGSQVLR